MADKKTPEQTAKIFSGLTKALVKGNPKPKATPKKKTKK